MIAVARGVQIVGMLPPPSKHDQTGLRRSEEIY